MKLKDTLNNDGINLLKERKELLEKDIEDLDDFDLELIKEIAEDKENN